MARPPQGAGAGVSQAPWPAGRRAEHERNKATPPPSCHTTMPPPLGFKQLMEKIDTIEDQCSDDQDKANRNKKKLQDKEGMSSDPFVQKKISIQEKIAETKEVSVLLHAIGGLFSAAPRASAASVAGDRAAAPLPAVLHAGE